MDKSLGLSHYITEKLQQQADSCNSHYARYSRLEKFRETRDLLKAVGQDVTELERHLQLTENAISQLDAVRAQAVAKFSNCGLYIVFDKGEFKKSEDSSLQ